MYGKLVMASTVALLQFGMLEVVLGSIGIAGDDDGVVVVPRVGNMDEGRASVAISDRSAFSREFSNWPLLKANQRQIQRFYCTADQRDMMVK